MRFPHYPGVGERIRERLLALGFSQPDGKPDIARFIKERHYDPRSFYPWLKGRTPAGQNLVRLARDLGVTPVWLLFGEEARKKLAGVLLLLTLASAGWAGLPQGIDGLLPPRGIMSISGALRRYISRRRWWCLWPELLPVVA